VQGTDGVITFTEGLPGFEACRQFVLVASPSLTPFKLLQGVGDGAPSFVAIDPQLVDRNYVTPLERADLARLAANSDRPLLWLALVTAHDDGAATVNLRAPLVINPGSMLGIQLIAADSPYRIDHPLAAA
jgi:flagellar assembly factor FliW